MTAEHRFSEIEGDPLHGRHMKVFMGPSHPATHGTVQFALELDGVEACHRLRRLDDRASAALPLDHEDFHVGRRRGERRVGRRAGGTDMPAAQGGPGCGRRGAPEAGVARAGAGWRGDLCSRAVQNSSFSRLSGSQWCLISCPQTWQRRKNAICIIYTGFLQVPEYF